MKYGKKIRRPMITEVMDATKTAPAATSLAFLAEGWASWVKEFTISSIAVFVSSSPITSPIVKTMITQSICAIFKYDPKAMVEIATAK